MKSDELKYEKLGDMMPLYPRSTLVIRKQFVDAAIAELKAENERLNKELTEWIQSAANRPIVISKIRNEIRETKRALWLARAELCHRLDVDKYLRKHCNSWYNENCLTWHEACVAMEVKMCKAESKCRAKAEEYK